MSPIHPCLPASGCIASVVEELQLHSSLGVANHVAEGSHTSPPSPACEAYTSFLLKVAGDASATVAQVSACMHGSTGDEVMADVKG